MKRIAITRVDIEIGREVLDCPSEFLAGEEANTARVIGAGVFRLQHQDSVEIDYRVFQIMLALICTPPASS